MPANFLNPGPVHNVSNVHPNDEINIEIENEIEEFIANNNLPTTSSSSTSNSIEVINESQDLNTLKSKFYWFDYDNVTKVGWCSICLLHLESDKRTFEDIKFTEPFCDLVLSVHSHHITHVRNSMFEDEYYSIDPELVIRMNEKRYINLSLYLNSLFVAITRLYRIACVPIFLSQIQRNQDLLSPNYLFDMNTLIYYITKSIRYDLYEKIKKSTYVSLIIDNSFKSVTDNSYVLYIRYLYQGRIEHKYLCYINSFDNLLSLRKEIGEMGVNKKNLITVGINGCERSASGLLSMIKMDSVAEIYRCPRKLFLNVLNYLLEKDEYFNEMVKEFDIFCNMYLCCDTSEGNYGINHYIVQQIREAKSKSIYKTFEYNLVSRSEAMKIFIYTRRHILTSLRVDRNTYVARFALDIVEDYRLMIFICFVSEIFDIMNNLSLIFKSSNSYLHESKEEIENCINKFESLKTKAGVGEQESLNTLIDADVLRDDELFEFKLLQYEFVQSRCIIIDKVIDYLSDMLSGDIYAISEASSVFDTSLWPSSLDDYFGVDKIIRLLYYYKYFIVEENEDECETVDKALYEWYKFKKEFKHLKREELLLRMHIMRGRFPIIYKLLMIVYLQSASYFSQNIDNQLEMIRYKYTENDFDAFINERLLIGTNCLLFEDINLERIANYFL